MANTATLASLRTRVRSLADQVNSQFISDAEINTWLNVGLSDLHDLLITSFEDYFENTANFTTVSQQEEYPLADNLYKLLEMNLVWPGGGNNNTLARYTIPRFMNRERNYFWNIPVAVPFVNFVYRLVNAKTIRLAPLPTQGYYILYRYAPQYAVLVADGDLVNPSVPQGWEEYAVLDAASRCLIKEQNSDPLQFVLAKKEEMKQRIMATADDRDANEEARVVDVARGGGRRDGGFMGLGSMGPGW